MKKFISFIVISLMTLISVFSVEARYIRKLAYENNLYDTLSEKYEIFGAWVTTYTAEKSETVGAYLYLQEEEIYRLLRNNYPCLLQSDGIEISISTNTKKHWAEKYGYLCKDITSKELISSLSDNSVAFVYFPDIGKGYYIIRRGENVKLYYDNFFEEINSLFSEVCKLITNGENIMAKSIYDIEENQAKLFMTVINEIIKEMQLGVYEGKTLKDFKKYGVTGRTLQILKKEHYITWHSETEPVWISWNNMYYPDNTILNLKDTWINTLNYDIKMKVELTETEVQKVLELKKQKEIDDANKKYDEMMDYVSMLFER